MRISNNQVRAFVQTQKEFKTNNQTMFGETVNGKYVVYSYGTHFPMYVYANGQWFGNSDKYSRTTSAHQSKSHPLVDDIQWMNTQQLKTFIWE